MAKNEETVRRISEVASAEEVIKPVFRAQDHMNTDFLISAFETRRGEDGKFYIIDAFHVESSTHCVLSTGSWMVDKQLQALDQREDLPLLIQFIQKDRSYYMA